MKFISPVKIEISKINRLRIDNSYLRINDRIVVRDISPSRSVTELASCCICLDENKKMEQYVFFWGLIIKYLCDNCYSKLRLLAA